MKVCSKCKVEKDESEFWKDKYSKDELKSNCKSCEKIRLPKPPKQTLEEKRKYKKRHYEANKQKYINKAAEWAKDNIDQRRKISAKYTRKYYKENFDKCRSWKVEWWQTKGKDYEKNKRDKMEDWYLVRLIKQQGRKHLVEQCPDIVHLKKIEIIIHRFKKIQNETKFSSSNSASPLRSNNDS